MSLAFMPPVIAPAVSQKSLASSFTRNETLVFNYFDKLVTNSPIRYDRRCNMFLYQAFGNEMDMPSLLEGMHTLESKKMLKAGPRTERDFVSSLSSHLEVPDILLPVVDGVLKTYFWVASLGDLEKPSSKYPVYASASEIYGAFVDFTNDGRELEKSKFYPCLNGSFFEWLADKDHKLASRFEATMINLSPLCWQVVSAMKLQREEQAFLGRTLFPSLR